MTQTVGLIGLGNMGRGMARSLVRAGFSVLGFDAAAQAREALAADIAIARSVAEVARAASIVILSLPHAAAVEAVVSGPDGLLASAPPGLLVIDTSTSEPAVTRRLASLLQASGHAMLDAPVSGGPAGAEAGTLTMVIGGEAGDLARAAPVLAALGSRRVHIGPSGAGHVAKLANNLLCAAHLLLAGEMARLAAAAGVPPAKLFEGINAGSGRSGVTEVNIPRWILNGAFDSGFTMALMRKDVRLGMGLAGELDLDLPLTAAAGALWAQSAATLPDSADFNRIVEMAGPLPAAGA